MAIILDGTTGITAPDVTSDGLTVDSTTLVVDEVNNKVGIGTSSPNAKLDVRTAGQSGVPALGTAGNGINITRTDGNTGGSIGYTTEGHIYIQSQRFDSSNANDLFLQPVGGNLLVGTTSTIDGSRVHIIANPSNGCIVTKPDSNRAYDAMTFRNFANSYVGYITVGTSSTTYATSSDYRLKEDWQPMTGASERVKALKPVNFAWKADGSRVDGFLAHEAQAVVPEAVTGEKDAVDAEGNPKYQGIDQSKLVPLLTAALQEALAEIETLKARVSALEAA